MIDENGKERACYEETVSVIAQLKKNPHAYLDVSTAACMYVTSVAQERAFPTGSTISAESVVGAFEKHKILYRRETLSDIVLSVIDQTYRSR